jgi:hypothetical protein
MHFRTTFNGIETQQMVHYTVLSSYTIVLTVVQNTNVLTSSCKVPQIFVRKLKIYRFVDIFQKKSLI